MYNSSHKRERMILVSVVIGIDVGGSTTKIVGFRKKNEGLDLIAPLFVRATDPITSLYGAFGKFTQSNALALSDIDKIMITGVGSSFANEKIYDLQCCHVDEFQSVGLGGLYISGLDEAIVVSMGTGTAIVHARKGHEPEYMGGTGVGGGTLLGLSKQLIGMDTISHIEAVAEEGDLSKIDLLINDIVKKDMGTMSESMTASNFGKVSDLATKSDIALGIINMVFETVGMMSIFAARNHGIKDIVLVGNLTSVKQAPRTFKTLNNMFDVNFIIPELSQFGTVIGAALSDGKS